MQFKTSALLVLLTIAVGCTHRIEMQEVPPGAEDFLPSEVGILIPAIIKSTTLWVNGKEIRPNDEFLGLVLQKVQRTHVFLQVAFQEQSADVPMREKAVHLEVTVNGVVDINQTANQLKLIVNCATLFLFSSVLPYKDEFDVTLLLKAVRYDGEERNYRSRIRGETQYRILGGEKARKEAQERVVTTLLNAVMHQVMDDIPFFAMEESS